MDRTLRFRQLLATRILHVAGLLAVVPIGACGGKVVLGDPAGEEGAGGDGSGTTTGSFSGPTSSGVGGASGSSGQGGFTTTGPGPTSVVSSVASTGSWGECGETKACFDWFVSSPCPSTGEAINYMTNDCSTGCWISTVTDGPYYDGTSCCYVVWSDFCGLGRPFLVGGSPRTAEARLGGGWSDAGAIASVEHLTDAQRALLAGAWTRDALMEHASVAAFSRFSLELLALGAPADLLADAHRAALDEVRHARLCFGLAGAYAGRGVAPSPLSLGGSVEVAPTLAALATSAVVEGCIGETLAAIQAAEQLSQAVDPAVRSALAIIAEDEARHAELAWRTVAWAIAEGRAEVRRAVEEAFKGAGQYLPSADEGAAEAWDGMERHGRLGPAERRAVLARGLLEVVLPCAARLLAGGPEVVRGSALFAS
jgi:hypothetical protein